MLHGMQMYRSRMLHGMIKYLPVWDVTWDDEIYRSGMLHGMIKYTGVGCCMG